MSDANLKYTDVDPAMRPVVRTQPPQPWSRAKQPFINQASKGACADYRAESK
jgi:hypothetical protein